MRLRYRLVAPLVGGLLGATLLTAPWWLPCRAMAREGMTVLGGGVLLIASIALAAALRLAHRRAVGARGLAASCGMAASAAVLFWALVAPNIFGALDRGLQKRTLHVVRELAGAMESHAAQAGAYPVVHGIAEDLVRVLPPRAKQLVTMDAWGNPIRVESGAGTYMIISHGCCGEPDVADPSQYVFGATHRFRDDLVYSEIGWVRYREGVQE